jgi:large subunit ribosomal protein L7/L12
MNDQQFAELAARTADLERKVDWLYRNAGYNSGYSNAGAAPAGAAPAGAAAAAATGGVSAEVLDLVRSGQPIHAIKLYREQTGVGLKQAKDVIDALS